jgi:hypothetical protein
MTTAIGSFPHVENVDLYHQLLNQLDIPTWPQLSNQSFKENMYVQFSAVLPNLILDEENEKIYFDTTGDLTVGLESFYTRYLADNPDEFALPQSYAAGFYEMLDRLHKFSGEWVKGHVTGPISFGLTVTDQDLRASLYNELLADVIVKNIAMNARWQVDALKSVSPNVMIFVDEPYMASFGSAYISLDREKVILMLDEVFEAIHSEGALAGVHCCGNTDWSVLMATSVDILNLDAFEFLENLALYPAELSAFLERGGIVAWGMVPNNEEVFEVTAQNLAEQLKQGMAFIRGKAQNRGVEIRLEDLAAQSLVTPSCGLGPATIEVANQSMTLISDIRKYLH